MFGDQKATIEQAFWIMLPYNMHSPIQLAFYCMSFKTSTKSNFMLSKDEYTLKTIKLSTRET